MAENANSWNTLFGGSQLSNHNGDPVDPSTLSSKAGVMLYFSAHWCPPCRKFTPQLVEYYKSHKDKFNFEIVFVSSDKDQAAFNEYWGEMPWLALPFDARDTKGSLSSKYKVQGIPSLVVLDNHATTINTGARAKVSADPDGFPWTPKTFTQIISGDLINGKDEKIHTDTLSSNTAIGIYFSAHWCPPCRGFTPKLVESYNKILASGKKFEIIFASSDSDEKSFQEYFHEMPWIAFPYQDKRISELNELYGVRGIPTLVIIDPVTGETINGSGRGVIEADPEGKDFPWHPKPLENIENGGDKINDHACFIYLSKEESEETKQTLSTLASHYVEKWKAEKKEAPLNFFFGNTSGLGQKVKTFTNLATVEPLLLILNIPLNAKHVAQLTGVPTEVDFRNFIEGFLDGTLAKKGIKE